MAKRGRTSITGPLVALVAVLGAFVIGVLWIIPKDDGQSRATILGILVTTSGAAVAYFTRSKVNEVQEDVGAVREQVNGRMSQILAQNAAQAEALRAAAAELAAYRVIFHGTMPPVSRETEGGDGADHQP